MTRSLRKEMMIRPKSCSKFNKSCTSVNWKNYNETKKSMRKSSKTCKNNTLTTSTPKVLPTPGNSE